MTDRIESFIDNHNISPAMENARSYIFDCPVCGGKRKLYIQKKDGASICFKRKFDNCPSPGSTAQYALSLISGLPLNDVKSELFDFTTRLKNFIDVSFDDNKKEKEEEKIPLVELPADISFLDSPESKEAIDYLVNRGLDIDQLIEMDIMYSPFMRRVIFPAFRGNGLYGWQGRAIDPVDHAYRMYNIPGIWKSKLLMFEKNMTNSEFAILVEGPIDALKFGKVGGFVASMGKEVSTKQLEIIKNSGIKKLYLGLDRDAADKIKKINHYMSNQLLGNKVECFMVPIPKHRDDFGDCTYDECVKAYANSVRIEDNDIFIHIEDRYARN